MSKLRGFERVTRVLVALLTVIALAFPFATVAEAATKTSNVTIYVNSATQSTKTLKASGLTASKAKWSTSNKAIATINSKGVVTAKKVGKATVTAKQGNNTWKFVVTVKKVTLSKTSATLYEGKTLTLKLTGDTIKSVKSSNTKVATIATTGKVTAKKAGTATITVVSKKGTKFTCKLTVKKVTLSKTSVTLYLNKTDGQTLTLKLIGDTIKSTSSSNTGVATVTKAGKVTAKKAGTATITVVSSLGKKFTCKVTVKVAVTGVSFKNKTLTIDTSDGVVSNPATVAPSNATEKTVTYKSSSTKVAKVDAKGNITPVSEGTATITATASGKMATCKVTVTTKNITVSTGEALNAAISSSRPYESITFKTDAAETVVIDGCDRPDTTLIIDAPNATIENYAAFKVVELRAISADTYIDHVGNTINYSAQDGLELTGVETNDVVTDKTYWGDSDIYVYATTDDVDTVMTNFKPTIGRDDATYTLAKVLDPWDDEDFTLTLSAGNQTRTYTAWIETDWQGLELTDVEHNDVVFDLELSDDDEFYVRTTTDDVDMVMANFKPVIGRDDAAYTVTRVGGPWEDRSFKLTLTAGDRTHVYTAMILVDWRGLELVGVETNDVILGMYDSFHDGTVSVQAATDDMDMVMAYFRPIIGRDDATYTLSKADPDDDATFTLTLSVGSITHSYYCRAWTDWQGLEVTGFETNQMVSNYSIDADDVELYVGNLSFDAYKGFVVPIIGRNDATYSLTLDDEGRACVDISYGPITRRYYISTYQDWGDFKLVGFEYTGHVVSWRVRDGSAHLGLDKENLAIDDWIGDVKPVLGMDDITASVVEEDGEVYIRLTGLGGAITRDYSISASYDEWQGLELKSIKTNDVVTGSLWFDDIVYVDVTTEDVETVMANIVPTMSKEDATYDIVKDDEGNLYLDISHGVITRRYRVYMYLV